MAVYRLDGDLWFPNPYEGEEDGLIAIGGDLLEDRLLLAYSNGIFPWFSFRHYKYILHTNRNHSPDSRRHSNK